MPDRSLKKRTLVAAILLLSAVASADEAYFRVEGMTCGSCAAKISDALKKVKGVSSTEINEKLGLAWVEYTRSVAVDPAALARTIGAAGYSATSITEGEAHALMKGGKSQEGKAACGKSKKAKAETAAAAILQPWEPADDAFKGCAGACGTRGENAKAIVQPGASTGDLAYCPVSGAVFAVNTATPKAEVGGKPLYFCCAGCALYFSTNQSAILAKRKLAASR